MKKENRTITIEEIKAKENAAISSANILIEESKNNTRNSPKTEFLNGIELLIVKLVEGNVSYRKIAFWIDETYAFKVSEQMVRSYAKSVLKLSTKKEYKKLSNETEKRATEHPSSEVNQSTVKEQKAALSNRELSITEQEETL